MRRPAEVGRLPKGAEGGLSLPREYWEDQVVLEPREDGLCLWLARPDARRVHIEVTARCNLHCAFCTRRVWRDAPGEMTWETFTTVVEQLRAFPHLRRVTFGGFGESLVHPGIVEMVGLAGTLGVGMTLTTNGLLLNAEIAEALIQARLDTVVISIDPTQRSFLRRLPVGPGHRALPVGALPVRMETGHASTRCLRRSRRAPQEPRTAVRPGAPVPEA